MWRPDGDEEVALLRALYTEVKWWGVIKFEFSDILHLGGRERVFKIEPISGNKEGGRREKSNLSCSNWLTAGWSALKLNSKSKGSDPKGVCWAWLCCCLLAAIAWFAILVGSVMDVHGPFHLFGSGPARYGSSVSLWWISTLANPFAWKPLPRVWRIFLNCCRLFSRAFNCFISFSIWVSVQLPCLLSTLLLASKDKYVSQRAECCFW